MTLNEVIKRAASIIGLELDFDYEAPSPALTKLIDAANMIYSELILEHVPLKTKETASVSGGKCFYGELSKNVREILSVRHSGNKIKFNMYPTYFALSDDFDGEVEVEYLFHLGELKAEDQLILPPQFTVHVIAMGVVSEFYFRTGMVDEATFYKSRYDNAVTNLTRSIKSFRVPARRFI